MSRRPKAAATDAVGRLREVVEEIERLHRRPTAASEEEAKRLYRAYLPMMGEDSPVLSAEQETGVLVLRLQEIDSEWRAIGSRLRNMIERNAKIAAKNKPSLRLVRTDDLDTDRESLVWAQLQKTTRGGNLAAAATLSNVAIILDNDTRWKGKVRLNTFARKVEVNGEMITDSAVLQAAVWMDRIYGMQAAKMTVQDAMTLTAEENPYNPIADYLNGLKWDGKPRCPHLFTGYLVGKFDGDDHKKLLQAFGVRWMISAVARVMDPGCKVDTLPVLYGAKGVKKSSAFSELVGDKRWFNDTALDPAKKDAMEQLQGIWVYEWSEFDIWLKKRGENRIRNFLSRKIDHFRWTHAINVEDYPRQGVFIASTNEREFMTDPERRFWPVDVKAVDLDAIRADRDQLWAEAVHRYNAGTQWHLTEDEDRLLMTSSTEFEQNDPWEDLIARTLGGIIQIDGVTQPKMPEEFSISQLLEAMKFTARDMTKDAENRAGQCLRALGYVKTRKRDGSSRSWVWHRSE